MSTITPLQALRRLVDIARLIDADECPEFYNQLQGELTVAGAVLATQADDFAHFLSYSGLSAESEEVKEKLQRAFEAGQPSSTVERFWNAVERQQAAQTAAPKAALTDEQIIGHWLEFDSWPMRMAVGEILLKFARAIEAAAGVK